MTRLALSTRLAMLSAIVLSGLVAGGCSKEITITRYPAFWSPQLKAIAVVPFRASDPKQGELLADQLANSLRATGTYRVFNRTEIEEMAKLQDIQIAFGEDQVAMAAQLRKISTLNVQAILTGRITNCTATKRDEPREEPITVWDPRTKQYVPTGQSKKYVHTRNEATVAATAALLDLKGQTIHSMAEPSQWQHWAEGSPPPMDAFACRAKAMTSVVGSLTEEFAVVNKKIKINTAETFRLASGCYDGKWEEKKAFRSSDKEMLAVLNLPRDCDRNRFRITVIRRGERKDLATVDVLWSSKFPAIGKEFSLNPADIASKGGGPGPYTVKFYSGIDPAPVHTIDFDIQ